MERMTRFGVVALILWSIFISGQSMTASANSSAALGPTTVNLVYPNVASAERGLGGFTVIDTSSVIKHDTSKALHGTASLYMKTGKQNHGVWIASMFGPKRAGTYTASAYVYGNPGDQVYIQLQEKGSNGTGAQKNHTGEVVTLTGNTWERIHVTATLDHPDGDSVGILIRSGQDKALELWVDMIQLELAPKPTDWAEPAVSKNLLLYNQGVGAELDTRGFIAAVGSGKAPTLSTDPAVAWQGNASLRVDGSGAGVGEGFWLWSAFVPENRGTYTASMYLKGNPGDRYYILFEEKGHAGTGKVREVAGPVFELKSSDWERHTFTTTMATGETLGVLLRHAEAKPFTVWVDGLQLEQGSVATEWISPPVPNGY